MDTAAAVIAGDIAIFTPCTALGMGAIAALIVHEVGIANGDVSRVEHVLIVVAAGVVVVVGRACFLLLLPVLGELLGTCACSDFVVGFTLLLFLVLVISACSFVWRPFGLALVTSDEIGDAAVVDDGGGCMSS